MIVLVVAYQSATEVRRNHLGGRKSRRAKVDLPEPDGPISTTSESSGMVMFTAKDRHLGRRTDRRILIPNR